MSTYFSTYEQSPGKIKEINVQTQIFFNHKLSLFRIILFFILLFWCIGFMLKSIFPHSTEVLVFSPVLKKIYSSVCYQDELKTFTVSGEKLFVCIRCTGIYLGALIFSFISIFLKKIRMSKKLFLAGLSAVMADVVLYSSGIFSYSEYFAFVTGFFFGSVAFLYILIILETEFFNEKY
jgi:uncharacterized membrane protein